MELTELLESKGHALVKKTANEYSTSCPFCGGKDRFCVWPEKNQFWCRQCDKKGDAITILRDMDGLTFEAAAEAVGKQISEKRKKPEQTKDPVITDKYDYVNHDGELIYQVCRYDNKDFKQRRPGAKNKWVWNMKDTPLVLYHLPQLSGKEYVFFVEGEKDVHTIENLGFPATTNPGGAKKMPGQHEAHSILDPLCDKRVYIIPDNDKPGQVHAEQTADLLLKTNIASEVKILILPITKPGGDITDVFEEKGKEETISILKNLVKSTDRWRLASNFISVMELDELKFDYKQAIISNGILPQNERLLIAGEGGVGKSMLRLELALHLAMGWDWLGFEIPRAHKVAIFQFENSENIEQRRMREMRLGMGIVTIPENQLKWVKRTRRFDLTLKRDQESLKDLAKESEADIFIYDCLSNIHSSNENDNVKMRNVLDVLTDIDAEKGTSSVLIHHFGKPQEGQDSRYRTRGASAIIDWAGCVIAFTRKPHETKILRKLEFIKVRDAPEIKPFLVERNGNFLCKVVEEEVMCSPRMVFDILNEMGGSVSKQRDLVDSIIERVQCSERSARTFIKSAIDMKLLNVINDGKTKSYYANHRIT
uniref:Putative ATPase domain containing protein n=1 Tax=viral metagenome TaxID=1070528 RepID=A0A6H1ZZX2_9ZZZZ